MTRLIHSVTFYRYGLLAILADGETYSSNELDTIYRATTRLSPRRYSPYAATRRLRDAGLVRQHTLRGLQGQPTHCWRITAAGQNLLAELGGSFGVQQVRKVTRKRSQTA